MKCLTNKRWYVYVMASTELPKIILCTLVLYGLSARTHGWLGDWDEVYSNVWNRKTSNHKSWRRRLTHWFPSGSCPLGRHPRRGSHSRYFASRVQLSSLAMSARLSHSAIGSTYDRTTAHCPNAAKLRPSPWWSSSGVTATTCLHSNWLLTTTLEQNKHTHRNARIPSG